MTTNQKLGMEGKTVRTFRTILNWIRSGIAHIPPTDTLVDGNSMELGSRNTGFVRVPRVPWNNYLPYTLLFKKKDNHSLNGWYEYLLIFTYHGKNHIPICFWRPHEKLTSLCSVRLCHVLNNLMKILYLRHCNEVWKNLNLPFFSMGCNEVLTNKNTPSLSQYNKTTAKTGAPPNHKKLSYSITRKA